MRWLAVLLVLWCGVAEASTQPIWGVSLNATSATDTEYSGVMGYFPMRATEAETFQPVPAAGTFFEACIWLSDAPGAGKSYTYTYRTGATGSAMSDTALTITIADTNTRGCNKTVAVAVTAGGRSGTLDRL